MVSIWFDFSQPAKIRLEMARIGNEGGAHQLQCAIFSAEVNSESSSSVASIAILAQVAAGRQFHSGLSQGGLHLICVKLSQKAVTEPLRVLFLHGLDVE